MIGPWGSRNIGIASTSLALWAVAVISNPVSAQVFTKLTAANSPGNPIVTDPGADFNSYSGASWIDFDQDGWPDLFVNRRGLYRNLGAGQFIRHATGPAGDGRSRGNSWADVDGDGDMDVLISGGTGIVDPPERGSFLFRNDGGVFVKDLRGIMADTLGNSGWGCAFGDYDLDGAVDAVITSANGFTGTTPNRLLHNQGDGTFVRDTSTDVTNGLDAYTIPTWCDFDQDGDPDLSIGAGPANGTVDLDYLYVNQPPSAGPPRLKRLLLAPVATDVRDGQVWNWVDIDNDRDLDVYITNYGAATALANDLYRNNGGTFVKQTAAMAGGIVSDRARSLASVWGDFDNDGDLDGIVTNDNASTNRYYRNNGLGVFAAVGLGPLTSDSGPHFGICAADYDKDGDLDLFVVGQGSQKALFRNDMVQGPHWVQFALRGTTSNRAAIGARIRIKAVIAGTPRWQMREVSAQNSFNGHNDLTQHFGLGTTGVIDSLVIDWPSGLQEVATDISPDACHLLIEGELSPTPVASQFELLGSDVVDGRVRLSWRTESSELLRIAVERTEDDGNVAPSGLAWVEIGRLSPDATGRLTHEDANVVPGHRYGYRLTWLERNGPQAADPLWVDIPYPGLALSIGGIQPIRRGAASWIELDLPRAGTAKLVVVDVTGRISWRVDRSISSPGVERIPLDPEHRLPAGLYFAQVTFHGEVRQSRFLVVR